MNIWIVTIGSSDVQLNSDTKNRDKGRKEEQRSDKVWHYWYEDEVQADCYDIAFEPKQSYKDKNEPYRIEPRILGTVYESSTLDVRDEIWSYLTFPLLDNFVGKLKNSPPDAIAVLLTDQSDIFKSTNARQKPKCPYWQDTCKLELILKRYFQDKFSSLKTESIELVPLTSTSSKEGLDNWDYVLDLVDEKLRNLKIKGEAIKVESVETAYVSHQAGTPAISSAVQFASLAQFEKKVRFLVSNEYDANLTELVPSSRYLHKIQREKAKQLLNRHDYSGVKELLDSSLTPEVKILLDAAIQWNFAKFEDTKFESFAKKLLQYPDAKFVKQVQERTKKENWWWTAYEAAYLAVVRLKQGNTVEAMFHSFRALEGLATLYAKGNGRNGLYGRRVFDYLKQQKLGGWNKHSYIKELVRSEINDKAIRNDILDKRNNLFHQLEGFTKEDLYDGWKAKDKLDWQNRVLHCLNFISGQSFTPPLEEASLMSQVHKELEDAIAQYERNEPTL